MEREITIERELKAPIELVWKAWTDKDQLEKWWGPNIFKTVVSEADLRVGGAFDLVMHGPGGVEYPMTSLYTVVEPVTKLAFTWEAFGATGVKSLTGLTTLILESTEGYTKATLTAKAVGHVPEAEFMLGGMLEGWTQSINRLEALF